MASESGVSENWSPSEGDYIQGGQGYFQYATGLAIINDPNVLQELHHIDVKDPAKAVQLLNHAKNLMWNGMGDVIRYANPPEYRSPIIGTETRFEVAIPFVIDIVETVAEDAVEKARLSYLNPLIPNLKPLPLRNEMVYKYIAHSRKSKLLLASMMDVFGVHDMLQEVAQGSNFEDGTSSTSEN